MPPIYHHGHAPSQTLHHSWRTVTNSAPHLLPHLARLSSTSSSFPIRVLDIGCGPGTLSASLAKHLPPTARIVATDISDDVLARAREHAVREGLAEMMEFVNADVCYLPFKDGEFEVVHAHQVLCHIEDPVKAIKEMVRVVKKEGGIISLREADVRNWHCWPELEGLRKMEMLMKEVMKADGGHPEAGMRLVEWCVEAGVKKSRIDMGFGSWCFAKEEDRRMWGRFSSSSIPFGAPNIYTMQERP